MKHILWDWNGTLLDDVDACIVAVNKLLGRRQMPLVDKEKYRSIFTFPVIEYYKKLGFNFEIDDFDAMAREYIAQYVLSSRHAKLFTGAKKVLEYLNAKGYGQSILSAMRQSDLVGQIQANGVMHYFRDIVGLQDIYATSKIDNAVNYMKKQRLGSDDVCFIGDTYHDYEVAKNIGSRCILIAKGHQELDRNVIDDAVIVGDIKEVCDFIS
jgi:phosphoglycolate phosphatase